MAFYVPLGSRGLILRLGAVLNRVLGGWSYRRSVRRRGAASSSPGAIPRPKLKLAAARSGRRRAAV